MKPTPADLLLKRLIQAFSEARTYFVFNTEYGELVAGPIGRDGASIRTYHDRTLYYVNAKNMEEMTKFMSGDVDGAIKNYCTTS